jgi:3-oxoacyl-[acyl-carrier protein] reductase
MLKNNMRNIIVTGGASGLGRYFVEFYLSTGANVVSLDKTSEPLSELAKQYSNLLSIECDLTDVDELAIAFKNIENVFGIMNILINNAGVIHNEPLFSFFRKGSKRHAIESWQKVIDINLTAIFTTTNFFVEQLAMNRKPGVIVNISSVSAGGTAGQSAYSASKAGVDALTKTWSKELGPLGIRAISIAPGYIDSQAMHNAVPVDVLKEITDKTALRKVGNKDNILQAVNMAINNDFMTGNIIDVNGGFTA